MTGLSALLLVLIPVPLLAAWGAGRVFPDRAVRTPALLYRAAPLLALVCLAGVTAGLIRDGDGPDGGIGRVPLWTWMQVETVIAADPDEALSLPSSWDVQVAAEIDLAGAIMLAAVLIGVGFVIGAVFRSQSAASADAVFACGIAGTAAVALLADDYLVWGLAATALALAFESRLKQEHGGLVGVLRCGRLLLLLFLLLVWTTFVQNTGESLGRGFSYRHLLSGELIDFLEVAEPALISSTCVALVGIALCWTVQFPGFAGFGAGRRGSGITAALLPATLFPVSLFALLRSLTLWQEAVEAQLLAGVLGGLTALLAGWAAVSQPDGRTRWRLIASGLAGQALVGLAVSTEADGLGALAALMLMAGMAIALPLLLIEPPQAQSGAVRGTHLRRVAVVVLLSGLAGGAGAAGAAWDYGAELDAVPSAASAGDDVIVIDRAPGPARGTVWRMLAVAVIAAQALWGAAVCRRRPADETAEELAGAAVPAWCWCVAVAALCATAILPYVPPGRFLELLLPSLESEAIGTPGLFPLAGLLSLAAGAVAGRYVPQASPQLDSLARLGGRVFYVREVLYGLSLPVSGFAAVLRWGDRQWLSQWWTQRLPFWLDRARLRITPLLTGGVSFGLIAMTLAAAVLMAALMWTQPS